MTAILNLRGNKKMFTKAQITRQAKQREEIKVKILKAFGEDFIKQKQKELCAICRLRRAGGGCSEGLYPIDSHGNVTRLIGNHELAYLTGEKIPGIDYSNAPAIRKGILDDISAGKLKAAEAINGELYTHAGVSLEKFPEWRGKDAAYIAADINRRFNKALEQNKWIDHIFDKGSGERGYKGIGGPFWLRTKETSAEAINLGYKQYFGHTPRPSGINEEAPNAINVDIGRQWTESWPGKIGAYQHTPKLETVERGTNLIESLGESPVHGQGFMPVQFSLDIPTIEEGAISQTLKSLSRHDRGQIDWLKPEDIRVTMEPPTNLTPNQISAANRLIKSVWDKNGTVDMQFKGVIGISKDGMPAYNRQNILWQGEASLLNSNPKNPAYIAMPLVSKSQKLFENQREIDAGLKRLGINANYAEFRPAIILGKFKPKISMKDRMGYMEKVMKNQPKSVVMIRAEKVELLKAKPNKNSKKSNKTSNKLDENYDESRYDGSESSKEYTTLELGPKPGYKPQDYEEYSREYPANKLYYPIKESKYSSATEKSHESNYTASEQSPTYTSPKYSTAGYNPKNYEVKDNTIETIPPPVITENDNQITKKQDSKAASEQDRPKLNNGDVAWKQGALGSGDNQRPVWYIQRANGDIDIIFQPPEGAPRLEGTPEETFFTRGKKPPTNLIHEMGVTTAKIDLQDNPQIKFIQTKAPKFKQSIPRHIRRSIGM